MTTKAKCLCGAVRLAISARPELAEFCHCSTCRRASGAPLMAWAGFRTDRVEIEGDTLQRYESSPGVERSFCGRCGTSMTFQEKQVPERLYVAVATMEDQSDCVPTLHIWRSERLPWMETADRLPRYLRFKRDGAVE